MLWQLFLKKQAWRWRPILSPKYSELYLNTQEGKTKTKIKIKIKKKRVHIWYTGPFVAAFLRKGKKMPLQVWTGPEGSGGLKSPDFKTIGT